ncbi:MAG: hypothetical protein CMK63_04805 [Pseudoalteromonadaceae bacterium]|nr:hypothetical protein [Pseudoalteromonadaceae bacterium]|tara:strand:- start:1818 stop:3173 length:1356 start_codon:yes stop_codon:yes gene_type:complete
MDNVFSELYPLSPYAKWLLVSLQTTEISERKLTQTELVKVGCPKNKIKKVIGELVNFNILKEHSEKHKKAGRPKLLYEFNTGILSHLPQSTFTNIEKIIASKLNTPVKLVWFFLCSNQDEYGYVESFSLPIIAKVCGLKNVEVKTAISKLIELNFIQQVIKGCTFKKIEIIGAKNERSLTRIEESNLKRSSCFKIIEKSQNKFSYLFTLPSITHFDSSSGRKKIYSLTGLLLDFYSNKGIRENVFLRLLRYEVSPFEHDFNFLYQQHKEVFRYFDEVLLKLVSMGLSHLINGEAKIKPVCQKDTFNHIFSPADYELSADNLGYGTSHLITKLANILIHYILYSIIYSLKDPPKIDGDIEKYLDSIQSLKSKDINIDALIRNIHSKVKFYDVYSIKNLTLFTNLDLTEKVNSNEGIVEFNGSKGQPTNGIYNIFHIGPEIFEAFYKNTLTSE